MKTINSVSKWIMAIALMSSSTIMLSCSKSESDPKPQITIAGTNPIFYNTEGRFLKIQATGEWSLSLAFASGTESWCTVTPNSGVGNKDNVILTLLSDNEGDDSRSVDLILNDQGRSTTYVITQLDASQGDALNPPPVIDPGTNSPTKVDAMKSMPNWMELPIAVKPYKGESAVVSHNIKIGTNTVRNFTMLYDTVQKVAYWVAYPIASNYFGSQKRTDKWKYDPKVPFVYQPNLTKGYPQQEGGKNKYDRGHQMPSADRTVNFDANAQTFYFTNMTAQTWQFNQGIWANLEDKVRSWAGASGVDTLYVVTGAILGNPVLYTKDRSNANVAVPANYYKVLLRLKGSSFSAIGFWFENRIYDSGTITSTYAKSVKEIETLTGFTFFTNLPDNIEASVKETRNLSDWGL